MGPAAALMSLHTGVKPGRAYHENRTAFAFCAPAQAFRRKHDLSKLLTANLIRLE